MPVEVRPFGVKCNIACQYCYQNPERDAGNDLRSYDLEKMMSVLEEDGRRFILFGGEPLLMPIEDLKRFWAYGLERFGSNGLQTNGVLVTEEHVRLFEEYKVGVGISIDGPGELNDVRWAGTLKKTRESTEASLRAIRMLCEAGIPPSLIVTLHRNNATEDKLPVLHEWFRDLSRQGVRAIRLHLLEVESESIRAKYCLSTEENLAALLSFKELEGELPSLELDMFRDMRSMLLGRDKKMTCIWTGCDPYTTDAVQGLEGSGQRTNCGRTNKDGIDFVKADSRGFERYIALYHTPDRYGGCQGCRFFLMCKGQCPGTSLHGDWRNKTEHCGVIKALYTRIEAELLAEGEQPLSVDPGREELEQAFLRAWSAGEPESLARLLKRRRARQDGERAGRAAAAAGA